MSSIRSPWETNYVSDEDLSNGFERGGGVEHRLLGSLIERSTSAPPLSSEGDLHFGHGGKVRNFCYNLVVCPAKR